MKQRVGRTRWTALRALGLALLLLLGCEVMVLLFPELFADLADYIEHRVIRRWE